jgi:hypothetical protein
LKVAIDRRYPMAQIVGTHRYVEAGHKRGNVVITLEQGDKAWQSTAPDRYAQ